MSGKTCPRTLVLFKIVLAMHELVVLLMNLKISPSTFPKYPVDIFIRFALKFEFID